MGACTVIYDKGEGSILCEGQLQDFDHSLICCIGLGLS